MVSSADAAAEPGRARSWKARGAGAIVVLAAFAAYWNSLSVPFFFDDPIAILENPTIRNLAAPGEVLSPPRNGSGVTGRPLVNLSLAVNYAIGGTSVTGYHLANILFHALGGLLLFGIVRRTLLQPVLHARFGSAAFPVALTVAALWTLHPLQTESVTCVIQRTELLVGLFYLLTLHAFIRATEPPGRTRWSVVAVAACFLGMASKEVMVTAPFITLLYDRTFVAGSFIEALRRRRGLYLGLGASLAFLAFLVIGMGGSRGDAAGFGMGVAWWSYALKQCEAILLYLQLTVWPAPLVVYYGTDVVTNPAAVWPHLVVLSLLVGAALWALWRRPVPGFAAMWFFAILAPSSSVVPLISQTVSEHRIYLSLAAPLAFGAALLFRSAGRKGLVAAGCAALALGALSSRRNTDYRSELSIWSDTVAKVPGNARARVNLATALLGAGRIDEAMAQFQRSLRDDPHSAEALNNIATILIGAQRPADAIEPVRMALRLNPKLAAVHNNLGIALVKTGQLAEGLLHLQTALSLRPDFPEAHCNLAETRLSEGDVDQAIAHAEAAIRAKPDFALARFHLASAFIRKNEPGRAIAELEAAIRANPDYAEAHSNLGSLHYRAGDVQRAIRHYEAALEIRPEYSEALGNLAGALFVAGRPAEAVARYREALRLAPDSAETYANLGLVLSQSGQIPEAIAAYEAALRLRPDDVRATEALARLREAAPARGR